MNLPTVLNDSGGVCVLHERAVSGRAFNLIAGRVIVV
jgi:hypothetical protein